MSQFPSYHKDSLIHQKYVTLFTQSTKPGSQRMDDVEDFDEISLNFSTLSNDSHANMESTSVIDNRVGSMVKSPTTFDSKEYLDSFLQLKIEESTKKTLFLRMTTNFKIIMKLPLMERVQTILSTMHLLNK